MVKRHYILATAGHVDHGKSSLVKALTGTDPDRLPEEKARGITIDLGFAHLELTGADGAAYSIGIVDVPGHEDFIKNMVSGVGAIDAALFVVAADDGWMPQTEEHLQILEYLGVRHAVVALTKVDLTNRQTSDIRERLAGSVFANTDIVPVSSVTGQGLEQLRTALLQLLSVCPPPSNIGKPRLGVDRVFSLHGVGTIVTGTLIGGELSRGQPVALQPGGRKARIRNLQSHNAELTIAMPGMRTAMNLPDVSVGTETEAGVGRGDVVTLPELGAASTVIDARIEVTARKSLLKNPPGPLKPGVIVRVHHGAANYPAKLVFPPGCKELNEGEETIAQVRFESPVYMFAGDHFIVRDWPEQNTLAGGLTLNAFGDARRWRSPEYQEFVLKRSEHPGDPVVFVETDVALQGAALSEGLLMQTRFSPAEIQQALHTAVTEGRACAAGAYTAHARWWTSFLDQAAKLITGFHRAHPQKQGLPISDLRAALTNFPGELFQPLLENLVSRGFIQEGTVLRSREHRISLPEHLRAAGNRVHSLLTSKGLEPPGRKELAPDKAAEQALKFLLDSGEAIELSPEIVLLKAHFDKAREVVINHLSQHRAGTVSELKQALGSSRRIVVPFLERLDKDGVTIREGDRRVLKRPS